MKKKKKIILITLGILILIGIIGTTIAMKNKKPSGMMVQTTAVQKEDIESHIQATGKIFSMDKRDIVSDVEEKIEKMFVKKGDYVKEGQILMKLEETNIEYKIKDAKLKLAMEEENLKQLKKEGNTELEIDLDNAKIKYEDAKKTYERNKNLYESSVISKADLEKSQKDMDESYNEYLLAKEKLKNSNHENEIITQKQKVELAKLEVEKLAEDLKKHTIKSPITGTIVDTNISESGIIESHVTLMSIQDVDHLEIVVDMNEYDASKIKLGDPVKITGDAFEKKEYKGKVKYIGSMAKQVEGSQGKEGVIEIKIDIENIDQFLKPGLSAKVDILTQKKQDVLTIPYEAIFTRKNGDKIIFTVRNGKVKEHKIKTGIESDFCVEIIGDVKQKDEVILNPTEDLKDGDQVMTDQVM
ncbi:efflux RND transporter periplasmic adaptor subunit [Inediibacterium massiliense]|uniref:efflux RND transporter periplasmic adaptor subunit n=1 Tax=Inediibacterium massiliense TaxID=1658111 RepID=UPI0006B40F20|nr:efflux RND transporter periplasmic adaptor subunit [Inediibacterium massiliense]